MKNAHVNQTGINDPRSDLSVKATRGMFWSLAENLGLQAVQLLISIILARLLFAAQFGLIGMLTLFMALAQSLLDSGFGSALIQKKNASHLDTCSVFYFNILVGVVLTAGLYLAAPLIARFYREPLLIPLTRFLSLSIIINGFIIVPYVLLTKRMDFRALLMVSLVPAVVSGGVGVAMAVKGLGVWSLAVQAVLAALLRAILVWWASRWRPSRIFSRAALATMFSFGSRLMLSGLLDTFFSNIYQPVIGRFYSPADVGYYVRAQSMQAMAVQPTGTALSRVMFPALSPLQDDRGRLKHAYRKLITTAIFFQFPLMVGLIVVARPLIEVLLTNRWASSVVYFQILCIAAIPWPLHVLNLNILKVTGRSDLFLRLEIVKRALVILALVLTFRTGIVALVWGQVAVSFAAYFLNAHYSGRLVNYSMAEQLRDIWPFLPMSLAMGVGMALVGSTISPMLPRLLAQVAVGVVIYLGLDSVVGGSVLSEVMSLARQAIRASAGS